MWDNCKTIIVFAGDCVLNNNPRITSKLILEIDSGWATTQLHPASPKDNCGVDATSLTQMKM